MSFEVFVTFWQNGEEGGVDEDAVREAFSPCVRVEEPNLWLLYYGERKDVADCEVYVGRLEGTELISDFMIHRPVKDERLWNSLYEIMRMGNAMMVYPDGDRVLVADASAIPHLPQGLEDYGPPLVVESGSEIAADIEES